MFLAAFVPAIVGALAIAMGSFIGRAIIALGVGFITYKGIGAAIDGIRVQVITSVQGLPAEVVGLLGFLWIDKAINIILSAITTALAVRFIGGSFKKMVIK